jgi:hypothetical protein
VASSTKKAKAKPKAKAKAKPKDKPKAPMSTSSAGASSRMGIKQYMRFRPDRQWATPLAPRHDQKTLGEWDAWFQQVLNSPAK